MIDIGDYDGTEDGQDDDWYDDDRDYREPDPEDAEMARSYEEHAEHCDQVHGGGECDCRTPCWLLLKEQAQRLYWDVRNKVTTPLRQPCTVRIGRAEITLRLNARDVRSGCGACHGQGWFYTKTGISPRPMPEGFDGVGLCGCGSAIARLADDRKTVRQAMKEPPF